MADTPQNVRVPPAVVDFGRALGADLPASLMRAKKAASLIRPTTRSSPKKKGG